MCFKQILIFFSLKMSIVFLFYLRNGFINYLLEKRAAGIVNVTVPNVIIEFF